MKIFSNKFINITLSILLFSSVYSKTFYAEGIINSILGEVTNLVTNITEEDNNLIEPQNTPQDTQQNIKQNPFENVTASAQTSIDNIENAVKNSEVITPKEATKIYGENLIPIVSATVSPEMIINQGQESGKMFLKTATIKCIFKNPISENYPETANFLLKVTFKYDKKNFVAIENSDSVTCEFNTGEDMRYKIVGNTEILPSIIDDEAQVATVSAIFTVFRENNVTGRKMMKECTHTDVFCASNGDIGYNATSF